MKLHLPLSLLIGVVATSVTGVAASSWDANWGAEGLAGAPDAAAPQYQANLTASGPTALVQPAGVSAPYDFGTYTAITLEGAGNSGAQIFGGASATDSVATGAVVRNTWIAAEAGQYQMLVGGNYADNWSAGAVFNFTGNSHILVNGANVATLIGGNYKDGQSASFTGNSYISVMGGNVSGSIVGAGVVAHNRNVQFVGDTNVFVYIPLADNSGPAINQLPPNMVMGGFGWATNTWKTQTITGDTHVTVDLSAYTGSAAAFAKHIVGGGFCGASNNAHVVQGDTFVTVDLGALSAASGVRVVGGHWVNAGSGTVQGTAHLEVKGGILNDWVVGASWTDVANTSTSYGGVQMQLLGGTLNGNVVGGSYLAAGAGNAKVGGVQVNIDGANLAGTLYGGYYINGTGTDAINATLGDISITFDSGEVNNIIGGSYVPRHHADSVVQQGDISISLQGGTVNGNVYAAGQQLGTTAMQTSSTTVSIAPDVVFADASVVSGGYAGAELSSTVSGKRMLVFGEAQVYTNVAQVVFESFDEVQVAAGAEVSVGGFAAMPVLYKTGAGLLSFETGMAPESIAIAGGTLVVQSAVGGSVLPGEVQAEPGTVFVKNGQAPLTVQGNVDAPKMQVNAGSLLLKGAQNNLQWVGGSGDLVLGSGSVSNFSFNSDAAEPIVDLANLRIEDSAALTLRSVGTQMLGTGAYVLGELDSLAAGDYTLTLSGTPFTQVDAARSFLVQESGQLLLVLVSSGDNPMANAATSHNARAGAELLWNAPVAAAEGDTTAAYHEVLRLLRRGDTAAANELMAASAGASYAALGAAFRHELRRRLYAIRNRTAQMGLSECYAYDDLPRRNAWLNADGAYSEQRADGTAAGYRLSSWGGTLGADIAFTDAWCGGLAFTALYGDYDALAPDSLHGNFDTYTLSLFAQYEKRRWSHTFIAAGSWLEAEANRSVSWHSGRYSTTADTHGFGLGLMYELGYKIPFNDERTAYVQPLVHVVYTHSSVRGFTESGSDAALSVGSQSQHSLVFGVGLRAQSTLGESDYGRFATLSGYALLQCHALDRRSDAAVAFADGGSAASVISAKDGVLGAEVGAGLTIPIGSGSGALFFDASAELRADVVEVFGAIGYRFRF